MQTGNAFFSLTYRRKGSPELRLTLLDDAQEAIAELVIAQAPWEESAAVPAAALSRFRSEAQSFPDEWPPAEGADDDATVAVSIESNGRRSGFEGSRLSDEHKRLLRVLATTVNAALVGARSRRAIEAFLEWLG